MRILIVNVLYAPDSFGGATLVAERTALELQAQGHEVFVLCGTTDSRLVPGQMTRYSVSGVPVVAVRVQPSSDPEVAFSNESVAARITQLVSVVRPEVVHFHSIQDLGVDMVEAVQSIGIPTVVTLHDAWWLCERQFMVRSTGVGCGQTAIDSRICATCVPDHLKHEARQARALRILGRCSRVLAPSQFWADLMAGSGVAGGNVIVNQNGVLHPRVGFRRTPRSGVIRIGFVGGLSPVKGYPQVVAALRHLRRSDYELHVVDSFSNLGSRSMSAADWPVPGLVKIVPGYTYETLDGFFASIDILLFPSQWPESFGLTVREALLRGVWPIVTGGGGPAEAVRDGVNGSIIPMDGDHRFLAEALASLLDSPDRLPEGLVADLGIRTFAEQARELANILAEEVARGVSQEFGTVPGQPMQ